MKRWPLIRHIRYWWNLYQMYQHYEFWGAMGYLPVHKEQDLARLDEIWRGER